MRRLGTMAVTGAGALAVMLVLVGCGSGGPGSRGGRGPAGSLVRVTERNFAISASTTSVPAGPVTLRIHNAGPDRHELIMLPLRAGESPAALPQRRDGFTVDEEKLANQEPGSINPQPPGRTEDLTVNLAPGRYVLFCNMEGHYMAGMDTVLTVTR